MIRQAAAVVIVLLLSPSWVTAQRHRTDDQCLHRRTCTRRQPMPAPCWVVVGRGAQLQVTREVGDWVKIAFPPAPDGVGYVRVSLGSVSNGAASKRSARRTPRHAARASVQPTPRVRPLPRRSSRHRPATDCRFGTRHLPRDRATCSGSAHRLGGPSFGLGASARGWTRGRLGAQIRGLALRNLQPDRPRDSMSSTEFGPSVLFSFNDHVADYTWLRPYLGAGMNFYRSTINSPVLGAEMSDSRYGSQLFGGGELSFASVPQFAISTELSYRWFDAPAAGFELGGVGLSVAGHWYMK